MPVCGQCRKENPPEARFCLACGAPISGGEAVVAEERKVVTVLFADLVGFTGRAERLDPEDVRRMLGPYYARLRVELERFGGTVEKFIGDAVMALFGAPIAHEDDPERAVRAALAIREAIGELNEDPLLDLHVRIAVATGEAVVSLGARASEGEGMAAGDVVNTTARLQGAAPGDGILVGESTYWATRQAIEYREAEPVVAKGKSVPIAVWEAVAPRARFGVDVARRSGVDLVGREEELALLIEALGRARRERTPQLVTLVGVPGIGKSRLVAELFAAVERSPELVFWRQGRSLPYGETASYWALAEMAKAQAGILETDVAEEAAKKLQTAIGSLLADPSEAEWVEAHLRPLIGLSGAGQLSDEGRGESFAAWRRFFEALAGERPLVLVFEDLHWGDDGLLDFVDHLVDWASGVPLFVVCTARPELLTRRPGWGGGKTNVTALSLSPLSAAETGRLVTALLDRAVFPAEIGATVVSRADGNPLYAEEFVRMLVDRGLLARITSGSAAEGELPLPESVQGIIAARLDALPADEKRLLQDAAVVGKVFWAGTLVSMADGNLSRSAVEDLLHRLERKEFVTRERQTSVGGETQYAFGHVLVRDVAYAQIPRARRAERHSLAAEWIESLAPDRSDDQAEMLAHHYGSALEYARATGQETEALAERARKALRLAGDRALTLNAFPAAARQYAAALELWPRDDPDRYHVLFQYGKASLRADRSGVEALTEARDALLAAGDRLTAVECEVLLGWSFFDLGRQDKAREHYGSAVALVEDEPPSRTKAFAYNRWAASHAFAGETEKAIEIALQAKEISDAVGDDQVSARSLVTLGAVRGMRGDRAGIVDLERALALAGDHGAVESVQGRINLASVHLGFGELKQCFEVQAEARRHAERFGLGGWLRWLGVEQALEHYWTGSWDNAKSFVDTYIAEDEAGSYMQSQASEVRGHIRLARGDLEGAVEDASSSVEEARRDEDPDRVYPGLAFAAFANVTAGRTEAGGALADELLDLWRKAGDLPAFCEAYWVVDLAFALAALGRRRELLETARTVSASSPWLEATIAFAEGDFRKAADVYTEIGSMPDEAFARLYAAEALHADGRRADADVELARARAFYESVGASRYLGRGQTSLPASA